MDSSCKYSVSPVDAVLVSMENLSLIKVPSNESIWPQRNCIVQTIDHLYPAESDENYNDTKISGSVGFSETNRILDVPSIVQNCDLANSRSYDETADCGSSYTDNSNDKSISGDGAPGELAQVRNSSLHPMILRPKTVSPRHCIITLYDDSETEESSDSDYTVALDVCDSSSSDEDSSDSEYETLAKEDKMAFSTDESSDSDEDTTESSSSDEEEMPPLTEKSSYSDKSETESASSDEEKFLPTKRSSDSDEDDTESSSSDEEKPLSAKSSLDSDEDETESSSSDEEKLLPTKRSSDSDEDRPLASSSDSDDDDAESSSSDDDDTESSSSDEEKPLPTKRSLDSGEDSTKSSNSDEDNTVHQTKKPSDSAKETSLLTGDSDEDCEAPVAKLDSCNGHQATSEDDSSELSRDVLPKDSDSYVECYEKFSHDSDTSSASNSSSSELDEEESTDDESIDLDESTEYSSEKSDESA